MLEEANYTLHVEEIPEGCLSPREEGCRGSGEGGPCKRGEEGIPARTCCSADPRLPLGKMISPLTLPVAKTIRPFSQMESGLRLKMPNHRMVAFFTDTHTHYFYRPLDIALNCMLPIFCFFQCN